MSADKIDVLSLLFIRAGKEKSRALERHKYGDPAAYIKFESEKSKKGESMEDQQIRTKEIESILAHELENWIRWGRKRDWMPVSFRCPLGFMYKSTDVHEISYKPLPCDEAEAVKLERIVVSLPEKHRKAFVMHHLDRAHTKHMILIVKGRDDKARLLGVHKSRYHVLVAQAHNMVLRRLKNI